MIVPSRDEVEGQQYVEEVWPLCDGTQVGVDERPHLRVHRYRRLAAAASAGLAHGWSSFRGTIRRVRQGAHREPWTG